MRYEANDILGKSLHYELDIDHSNEDGWLVGIARLFEVTHVAPGSTCTTEIRIKITLALGPGTMVSYTRIFEPYEFGTGSWNPWLLANGWQSWAMAGDWEEMRMRADAPASGTIRLVSGQAVFKTLYGNVPQGHRRC